MRLCEQVHTGKLDPRRVSEAWGDFAPTIMSVVSKLAGQKVSRR